MYERKTQLGIIFGILSAIIYGCQPLGAKLLYAEDMNSLSLVMLRNLFAFPILLWICVRRNLIQAASPGLIVQASATSLFGITLAPLLLFSSYNYIASGTATAIHFFYPVFVFIIGAVFFKEKLSRIKILCLILSTLGVLSLYSFGEWTHLTGVTLAALSAVSFAIYTSLIGHTRLRNMPPFLLALCSNAISSCVLIPVVLSTGSFAMPQSVQGWIILLLFSFMVSVLALLLFKQSTKWIGSEKTAVFSTFEPVTSIIIGITVFHESFTLLSAAGIAMVLFSVALLSIEDRFHK